MIVLLNQIPLVKNLCIIKAHPLLTYPQLLGTLEQIEVIQNGIQYEGIAAIADCIKHSPNLKILNLNDNIMTPRGAIAIAKVLDQLNPLFNCLCVMCQLFKFFAGV